MIIKVIQILETPEEKKHYNGIEMSREFMPGEDGVGEVNPKAMATLFADFMIAQTFQPGTIQKYITNTEYWV